MKAGLDHIFGEYFNLFIIAGGRRWFERGMYINVGCSYSEYLIAAGFPVGKYTGCSGWGILLRYLSLYEPSQLDRKENAVRHRKCNFIAQGHVKPSR